MRSNILQRAVSSVRQLFGRDRHDDHSREEPRRVDSRPEEVSRARPVRREPDIPFDRLSEIYSPHQTSLKTSFRASGKDRQRDQEFADGIANERWNDEDQFTNKSGDPRIGTHGRTYEPGERKS